MTDFVDAWDHVEFWMKELTAPCFVYVMRSGTATKVGKANNVYDRYATLQGHNPVRVELLHAVPGDYQLETRLLRWLRPDLIHGEWFEGPLVPEVLAFVAELSDRMLAAYQSDGVAPSWRGMLPWPSTVRTFSGDKPKRKPAEVTVRHVDPSSLRRAS